MSIHQNTLTSEAVNSFTFNKGGAHGHTKENLRRALQEKEEKAR